MKKTILTILLSFLFLNFTYKKENSWIRINQLGYLPQSIKVAVLGSKDNIEVKKFSLVDAKTDKTIYSSDKITAKGAFGPFTSSYRLNFSDFKTKGEYYLIAGNAKSPIFKIDDDIYDGTADFLLKYMRQQRCGYNPYLTDSCHVNDGYIVYNPNKEGQRIDVTGGWHDASDYLQYTATSANAIFQLLLSYRENPEAFIDVHQANGLPGPNGIPDVIDEAKFGMDWLLKMNPSPTEFYNQIADDRDHAGYRLPNHDSVVYHPKHIGRPVYLASPKPQGYKKYKNRSTGLASTTGKYASAFALGADVLKPFYPNYVKDLTSKAENAFQYGKKHPGVSQTAPGGAPYFYEEENWHDDMELAAASLYKLTEKEIYKQQALNYAAKEKISPWMGKDTARHYQYYPFLNVGHFELASTIKNHKKQEVINYYKKGLELLQEKGNNNPFLISIPFVWCSNNFVTAAVTQCKLYRELTNDNQFLEMETALRDWLFGCNPWGTSMIVGLPSYGDTPEDPHSSLNLLYNYQTDGGLVDGPVYGSIFNNLIGLELHKKDAHANFQSDYVVYHDDVGDYSTNEPTMDGTASLIYYLSSLENESRKNGHKKRQLTYDKTGAIIRGDTKQKYISLVFTGHEFADGAEIILNTLNQHNIKASFFLTGDFYRNPKFKNFIERAIADGHYLGAHSDKHLLYNDWSKNKKRLVSFQEFKNDLDANYHEMEKFGLKKEDSKYFLPPYEWNDEYITQWANRLKLTLINYTPGTLSHADYTLPKDKNYKDSETIYNSILNYEANKNLNGFMLLSHIGTDKNRTDKFYLKLDNLINELNNRGYKFISMKTLLDN
ncbi:cellulase [Aureibaculum marinum]|uniref:Cellulase n=1 Tax=Aureibaculum marinum TaxID=2487930 RepID=A0A3N4NJV7_9FLAO|nr:glycoside hydrolase family 9 protein [Aureibaculum marinum]RPD96604.1 cellulase [Aureibaculum marinum]